MEEISTRVADILNNKFITDLLKNDVVFYGRFIREILINNKSLEDYSKDTYNIINCYAKYLYSDIIERDIYPYLTGRVNIEQTGLKKNHIVAYEIAINDKKFVLDIVYIKTLYSYSIQSFESDLNCNIDIDSLCLRRTGLSCLDIFGNLPFPFGLVLNNINKKCFSFKSRELILNSTDNLYISELIKEGYTNNNSKLCDINEDDAPMCSICYDNESSTKKYTKLACGHIYHKCCLSEAIKEFFSDQAEEYYQCPYCSKRYCQIEII